MEGSPSAPSPSGASCPKSPIQVQTDSILSLHVSSLADVFLILNISEELGCSVIEKNSLTAASSPGRQPCSPGFLLRDLSYYNEETILFTIDPYYGNLNIRHSRVILRFKEGRDGRFPVSTVAFGSSCPKSPIQVQTDSILSLHVSSLLGEPKSYTLGHWNCNIQEKKKKLLTYSTSEELFDHGRRVPHFEHLRRARLLCNREELLDCRELLQEDNHVRLGSC